MFAYPIDLTPDDNDTLLVTSPDFPELTTFGDDREGALTQAADALRAVIDQYMSRGLDIPAPSPAEGRPTVALSTLVAGKVALYRAMRETGTSQVQLAQRLGCDPRQVRRLLDPLNASRFDQIDEALSVLGKRLDVQVLDAA